MKVYMIGEYKFDGSDPFYRCFYEESDAKSCALERIEESEDNEEDAEATWEDFLDRWDCWVCFMEVLEVE